MFSTTTLTDEMVRAATEGSREDFARVAEAVRPQVRLMILARLVRTTAQVAAVDDIAQEVMLALTEGIARLRERTVSGLKAFVSGIVAHKVNDQLRRPGAGKGVHRVQSLDSTVGVRSDVGPLWTFLSTSGTSPSDAAGRNEMIARFFVELGKLKREYHEVITLALVEELRTREIGERVGLSRNATAMRLKRACNTLRQNMSRPAKEGRPPDDPA